MNNCAPFQCSTLSSKYASLRSVLAMGMHEKNTRHDVFMDETLVKLDTEPSAARKLGEREGYETPMRTWEVAITVEYIPYILATWIRKRPPVSWSSVQMRNLKHTMVGHRTFKREGNAYSPNWLIWRRQGTFMESFGHRLETRASFFIQFNYEESVMETDTWKMTEKAAARSVWWFGYGSCVFLNG
jgi:hypothetical protein